MTILTTALAVTDVLGGDSLTGGTPSKDEEVLKKCLDRLADALKRLARKAVQVLSAIMRSVAGVILSFLGKVVGSC